MGNDEARANNQINDEKKIIKTTEVEDKIKNKEEIINNYQKDFDENSFWVKIKNVGGKAGIKLIAMSLILYYSLPKLSFGDKVIAIGALGYFISPLDIIPDAIPVIGYLDDMSILAWAVKRIIANMKNVGKIDEELRNKVKIKLQSIFGKYDETIVDELFD